MSPSRSRGTPFLNWLRNYIWHHGPVNFRDYMDFCLYHPQYGYYAADRAAIGKEGDFYTSASVHPVFGTLMAKQLVQMWELLERPSWYIVEQGPGEGYLARDILDALAQRAPECYAHTRYLLLDVNEQACLRQRQLLAAHAGSVFWPATYADIDNGVGVWLSNELLDAMPVHVVEMTAEGLREVFVDVKADGGLQERLQPLSSPALTERLVSLGIDLVPGNRYEVCLELQPWLKAVATHLQQGYVITVDYGYPAPQLYDPLRRRGTLLCYRQHQAHEDFLAHPGEDDMTAHVDLTSLMRLGEEQGLYSCYCETQYHFLLALGFAAELETLCATAETQRQAEDLRRQAKHLILPDSGMGETFKVVIQARDAPATGLLCQRSMAEIAATESAL